MTSRGLDFFVRGLETVNQRIFSQNGFVQNGDESHGRIRETSPQTNKSKGVSTFKFIQELSKYLIQAVIFVNPSSWRSRLQPFQKVT